MLHNIPQINEASIYARSDTQKLVREILRIEGIRSLQRMNQDF